MNINRRLEKLERFTSDDAADADFVRLELAPDWSVEIPAKIAPQVFENIEKIYGQKPA